MLSAPIRDAAQFAGISKERVIFMVSPAVERNLLAGARLAAVLWASRSRIACRRTLPRVFELQTVGRGFCLARVGQSEHSGGVGTVAARFIGVLYFLASSQNS